MAQNITTYTGGFNIKASRNISRKEYIEICNELSDAIGNGIKIVPEPITEGGWLFKFPETDSKLYKTMRHHGASWSWITKNTPEEWINDETAVFIQGEEINTTLKAFNNAPAWTLQELKLFGEVLTNHGIKITRYPGATRLKFKK